MILPRRSHFLFVLLPTVCLLWLAPEARAVYDDAGLNSALQKFVKDGQVNYNSLRRDSKDLDLYLAGLRQVSRDEYLNWSTASKKAFWINAFNAIAIKQAADHYPCEAQTLFRFALFPRHSPQNVDAFFSKKKFRIIDDLYSLDLLQKLVLRVRMHDAKTLFATCPAARGGPRLRSSAYEGPHLAQQLEEQIKAMLTDPKQFRIDRAAHAVVISDFFKSFGEDFIPLDDRSFDKPTIREKETAVREFIMDYVSKEDAEFLKDPTIKFIYTKYDWTLNASPS